MAYRSKEGPRDDRSVGDGGHVDASDAVDLLAEQHVASEHQSPAVLLGDAAHVALEQDQVAFGISLQIRVLVDLGEGHAPADLNVARDLLQLVVLIACARSVL